MVPATMKNAIDCPLNWNFWNVVTLQLKTVSVGMGEWWEPGEWWAVSSEYGIDSKWNEETVNWDSLRTETNCVPSMAGNCVIKPNFRANCYGSFFIFVIMIFAEEAESDENI